MNINKTFDHDDEVIKLVTEQGFGYLNATCDLGHEIICESIKSLLESFISIV